jgi:hypothetical protein
MWAIAALGIWRLSRRGVAFVVIVGGPLVALFVASALQRYPVAPRVCVFAAPLVFLIDAAAVDRALAWRPAGWRHAVTAMTALWVVTIAVLAKNRRFGAEPTRAQVQEFERRAIPREPVYVFAGEVPTWTVYTTDWHAVDRAALATILARQAVDGGAFQNAPSRGRAVDDTAGAALVVRVVGRVEVLGLAPGIQWLYGAAFTKDAPDPGWGAREAMRLRAVTDSTAWVAIAHDYPGERRALLHSIALVGGRGVFRWSAPGVALIRYRFPRPRRP